MPQANSTTSMPRVTSPAASDRTLPCSAVMIAASLLAWSHGHIWPVIAYFLVLAAMALISTLLVRETRHRAL